jgi:hypothetical protein
VSARSTIANAGVAARIDARAEMQRAFHKIPLMLFALTIGCAASYKADPLAPIESGRATYFEEIDGVTLGVKRFSARESKKYLGRDVLKAGYQPIQLSIDNRSERRLVFTPERISLPCTRADDVADEVHSNTVGHVIVGVLLLPVWWILDYDYLDEAARSSGANKDLDADFAAKSLSAIVIEPNSYHEGLLFIPKESFTTAWADGTYNFVITIVETESKRELAFAVTVR